MKWAVAPSAPTLLISETGRVVRMASSRRKGNGWQTFPEVELRPRRIGAGYLAVNSKDKGVKKTLYLHRLVAESFLGKPIDSNEVNHKDGNKANNSVSNLEWTTHSKNLHHAISSGLTTRHLLTPDDVRQIRELIDRNVKRSEIARLFGVSPQAISRIKNGRCWAWLPQQRVNARAK
jgi:hypothetical protein